MSRLIVAAFALGLVAPVMGGTAEAQVWKVKRNAKPGAAKPPAKKPTAARTRPGAGKKKATAKPSKRQVELVPDEQDDRAATDAPAPIALRDRADRADRADERIVILVEEVFD